MISQYIGRREPTRAGEAASQLLLFSAVFSMLSTIAGRLFLSYFLGVALQMGVMGIAVAMVADWVIRAIIFYQWEKTGRRKDFQVI